MKVLVTGITGILGQYLSKTRANDVTLTGVSRDHLEASLAGIDYLHQQVLDLKSMLTAMDYARPDVLVHAAAEGSVDAVEADPAKYRYLNEILPGLLAEVAKARSIQYVYISSNAVYGKQVSPWTEQSIQSPINKYGHLKRRAEVNVREANASALIIRPIMMYGWPIVGRRENLVSMWVKRLRLGQPISVVGDLYTQPLFARDCAEATWMAIRNELEGSLNISGGSTLSLFDFACLSARVFGLDSRNVSEIATCDLEGLAPRPDLTEFDLSRLNGVLGFVPADPIRGLKLMENECR